MLVEVPCPGCGAKLKIPDNMTGKKARCKKCKTSFRIPGASTSDSVGESHALSVVSMPAIPTEDESVPMAAAVEEDELPPSSKSAPAAANNISSLPSADPFDYNSPQAPKSPAQTATKPKVNQPINPVPSRTASGSETSPISIPSSSTPARQGVASVPAKPQPAKPQIAPSAKPAPIPPPPPPVQEERVSEADPFQTPFSPAPEAPTENDPFSFGADPPRPAKTITKQPERREEEQEKSKVRGNKKAPPPDEPELLSEMQDAAEPAASDDLFSFSPAPTAHDSRANSTKKKQTVVNDNDTDSESGGQTENAGGRRRYGRHSEQNSNKLLRVAVVFGVLAVGAAIAAVIAFSSKPEEAKKTTEKKDETPPTPPPVETPPETPTTPKIEPAKKDTGKKNTAKKDTGKKDPSETPPKQARPSPDPAIQPVAMLALPKDLSKFTFRAPKDKPESTQTPSGTPIQVDVAFNKVKRFFPASNRNQTDAFVVWQSNAGFNGRGEKLSVDAYSGGTGSKVGRFEFDGDGKEVKCDVSSDGKLFIAAADGKVTIWNLTDKTKAIDGFDPYADKPNHKKAGLAAVYIPSIANNFLTVSTAGAMHLFEIASKSLISEYVPENGVPGRVVIGKNLAADETRSSIVVSVGGSIHQVRTLDLKLSWKLQLGGEAGRSFGISVAGVPGRIAYAFETDADKKKDRAILFCLPESDPKIFRWQDSAGEPTSVNWSGTEFAVVGTTNGAVYFEYDTESKAFTPLAMAQVPGGKGLHEATERAHWYLIPNPKEPTKSLMMELSMPIADIIDFRNTASNKQPLETLKLDDRGLWR